MGKVILLLGSHGVGKSSLLAYAETKEEFLVFEGFKISSEGYSLSNLDDFTDYQNKYLRESSRICEKIKKANKNGIVIRSIEESSFYYHVHPCAQLAVKRYQEEIAQNQYCGADILIYLDAEYRVLQERCLHDKNRNQESSRKWYQTQFSLYENYWKNYPGVKIIDTTSLQIQELYERIKNECNESERPLCSQK